MHIFSRDFIGETGTSNKDVKGNLEPTNPTPINGQSHVNESYNNLFSSSREGIQNLNQRTSVIGSPFELVQPENKEPQMRRSTRERRMLAKFSDYELLFAEEAEPSILISEFSEPTTYKATLTNVISDKWQAMMCEEMDSLLKNQT